MTGLIFYIFSLFLSYNDCKSYTVPNFLVFTMFLMMLVFGFIESKIIFSSIVLSVLVLIFFIIVLLIKPTMILGGGDIKLAFVIGYALGFRLSLIAIILSSFLALPYSVASLKLQKNNEVPFGPFLVSSLFIVFLFQDKFINILGFFN